MISETGSETPDLQAQGQTRRSVMTEDRFHAIDTLLVHLKTALSEQDWEEIAKLNQLVRPTIEPVMTALEAGELDQSRSVSVLLDCRRFAIVPIIRRIRPRPKRRKRLKGLTRIAVLPKPTGTSPAIRKNSVIKLTPEARQS